MTMSKHDERLQQFADELVKKIEANEAPWQKGWVSGMGDILPVNHQGKPYRGNNLLDLMMVAQSKGYNDNRWYTFNNAKDYGGHVRKGEKGTVISFYSRTQTQNKRDEQGNPIYDKDGKPEKVTVILDRPIVTTAVVFNAEQIEGLPARIPRTPMSEWERHEKAESIIKGIEAQGVSIEHKSGDRAYYSLTTDKIVMPERGQFATADAYYATILHEIGHATGHESRLNRDLTGNFGSESYAKEELRAEIASMIVGGQLEIGYDPSQHHAYLQSWVKVIKEDPKEIFRAVKDADEISNYVIGLGREFEIAKVEVPAHKHEIFKVPVEIQEKFNKDVERLNETLVSYPQPVKTKMPPVLLALNGEHDLAIEELSLDLDKYTLKKMQGLVAGKQDTAHSLTLEDINKTLKEIYDPVAVLKSDNGKGLVILTAIETKYGDPIIVPIHLEKQKGKYVFNEMASAFGNDNLKNWLNNSPDRNNSPNAKRWQNLIYFNQEKSLTIGTLPHLLEDKNLPVGVVSSKTLIDSLVKPEDIVKRYNEILLNQSQQTAPTPTVNVPDNPNNQRQTYQLPQEKRIYLYTSYEDVSDLQKLNKAGIAKFDAEYKVWYAQEKDQQAVSAYLTPPFIPTPEDEFADYLHSMGINVEAGHPIFDDRPHRLSNAGSTAKNVMYQAYGNPHGVPFARVTNFSKGGSPENWQYPTEYLSQLKNIEAVEMAESAYLNSAKTANVANRNNAQNIRKPVTTKSEIWKNSSPKLHSPEQDENKKEKANLMATISKTIISISDVAPPTQNYLSNKQVTANDTVLIVPHSSKLPDEFKDRVMIADTFKQAKYYRENNPDEKLILQRGNLVVPQYNTQGELRAFETIAYNGGKYALKDADKKGLMTTLGQLENGKPIIITEGYATGATLHEHTRRDKPAVVVAFGRGGLREVTQTLRENYPDSKIYIGADNDHQKPLEIDPVTGRAKINQGLEDAKTVADAVKNVHLLVPQFSQGDTGKDWNDIYVDKGAEEFKRQVIEQLRAINRPIEQDKEKTIETITQSPIETVKEPVKPPSLSVSERLTTAVIKQNYPTMPEETLKAIEAWCKNLPIKYANEPLKSQFALERLESKLSDYAKGEILPFPKSEVQLEPPDKGINR